MSQLKTFKTALLLFLVLTIITGGIYPLLITSMAQLFFPHTANGSLVLQNTQYIGSELIGQHFDDPRYFWGRLSATQPIPYNAAASAGSNLGPSNPVLLQTITKRIQQLHAADPHNTLPVPIDLVTASASGLDPEISPAAAYYQIKRIAQLRHLPEATVIELVQKNTAQRTWKMLGEPRVNVLKLNLALDNVEKGIS